MAKQSEQFVLACRVSAPQQLYVLSTTNPRSPLADGGEGWTVLKPASVVSKQWQTAAGHLHKFHTYAVEGAVYRVFADRSAVPA